MKWVTIASLLASLATAACSPAHGVRHHELSLKQKLSEQNGELGPDSWGDVKKVFSLYAVDHKLTAAQIVQLFTRFTPGLTGFIQTTLNAHPQATYTYEEFAHWLEDGCVTLTWLKAGSLSDESTRLSTLKQVYPDAHPEMVTALNVQITRALPRDQRPKANDILKLGVFLNRSLTKTWPEPILGLQVKLVKKQLWSLAPEVPVAQYNDSDRKLSAWVLALRFAAAQKAKPSSSGPRERHRLVYQRFGQFGGAVDPHAFEVFEAIDWELDESISGVLAGQGHGQESVDSHLKFVNPQLFAMWDDTHPYLQKSDVVSIQQDLLSSSAFDDILHVCQFGVPPKTTHESVQVFLFRLSVLKPGPANAPASSACHQIEEFLHPDMISYEYWRLRAFVRSQREASLGQNVEPNPGPHVE